MHGSYFGVSEVCTDSELPTNTAELFCSQSCGDVVYMGVHSVRMHVGFVLEGSDFVDGAVAIVVLQYSRVCFCGI